MQLQFLDIGLCERKIQGIFCDLARRQKTDDMFMWDDVVLDRPPFDVYITYSVYRGTIREIVKMKDFKGGMGRAKSSLDRPWNPGTMKGRFDSTYSVYWGTIREVVKMIDFKEGNGPREIVPRSSLKSRDDEGTIR